jgi:gluconolactonase
MISDEVNEVSELMNPLIHTTLESLIMMRCDHRFVSFVAVTLAIYSFFSAELCAAGDSGLIADGAKVEKLADGFQFTEGPTADSEGNVYFSDIPASRIHIWSVDGKLGTFRENSGQSNGLMFDSHGNLIACEGGTRQLTSIAPDKKVTVLANSFGGKKLNSPNDLWIDPQGGIYFSDPRYGKQDGVEQDGHHVYYLAPGEKELKRVIGDMKKPNGLVGTPDGKQLYVTDEGGDKTYVYQIGADGTLSGKKLLVEKGSDGMTRDENGNLYLTNESVWIYSPDGKLLEEIKVPEGAANVCFGGKDRKTLFITARKGLYSLRMNVSGR